MEKDTLEHANKAAYIALVILAALVAIAAMVFGMLDMVLPSYTAAGCSCLVTVSLIFHTLRVGHSRKRR